MPMDGASIHFIFCCVMMRSQVKSKRPMTKIEVEMGSHQDDGMAGAHGWFKLSHGHPDPVSELSWCICVSGTTEVNTAIDAEIQKVRACFFLTDGRATDRLSDRLAGRPIGRQRGR